MMHKTFALVVPVLLAFAACADPVHDAEVAALGPENPSVPEGPLHRPGQPCLLCHSDFSVAGTVYNDDLVTPLSGATVTLVDSTGSTTQATTNSAGNFFILASDWTPVFPIGSYEDDAGMPVFGVTVVGTDPNSPSQMLTHIGRDGSCASCHFGAGPSTTTPGPVYVTAGTP
jgi:hypothetical protein